MQSIIIESEKIYQTRECFSFIVSRWKIEIVDVNKKIVNNRTVIRDWNLKRIDTKEYSDESL